MFQVFKKTYLVCNIMQYNESSGAKEYRDMALSFWIYYIEYKNEI